MTPWGRGWGPSEGTPMCGHSWPASLRLARQWGQQPPSVRHSPGDLVQQHQPAGRPGVDLARLPGSVHHPPVPGRVLQHRAVTRTLKLDLSARQSRAQWNIFKNFSLTLRLLPGGRRGQTLWRAPSLCRTGQLPRGRRSAGPSCWSRRGSRGHSGRSSTAPPRSDAHWSCH